MTKRQRRAGYLEAARAVLEDGRGGVYGAFGYNRPAPELDKILEDRPKGESLICLPADLRAMLLIMAATI